MTDELQKKLREIIIKRDTYDSVTAIVDDIDVAYKKAGYLDIKTKEGMDTFFTGQQWFSRFLDNFEAETLAMLELPEGTVTNNMFTEKVMEAAKRAAGISE